jgi:predicted DNA-binding transcriptional regulator YafY|tara:strand:+ start:54164 stop:55102 length:939 start_codon:yes stop_codon:yes gene_type:complete
MATEKLERILKLLTELLNASTPKTADELRNKINMYPDNLVAFRKQFSRDKASLKEMGVPLEVVPVGPSGNSAEAYYVDNNKYYLPDLNLSEEELAQLNYAANSVHLLGAITEEEALRKLGGYSGSQHDYEATVSLANLETLNTLFEALSQRKQVTMIYSSKRRTVQPYLLQFKGEHWYLTGNEIEAGSTKSYRTDRIQELQTGENVDEYSLPRSFTGADFNYFSYGDDVPVTAKLLIDRTHIKWVEQNLDIPVSVNSDGNGIAEFLVRNHDSFINRVLLLLHHAEILEPDLLRDKFINRLQHLQKSHEDNNA